MKYEKFSIYASVDFFETRVVVMRKGVVEQFLVERGEEKLPIKGNVYYGRVIKVLPGIKAAFIDIGLDKAAFLPSTQVFSREFMDAVMTSSKRKYKEAGSQGRRRGVKLIEKSINAGERLFVQVLDIPGSGKGPKVTTYIGIAGHYVVYMPALNGVGVSRKIRKGKERARLKNIGESLAEVTGGGVIIRSASEGVSEDKIKQEALWLRSRWMEAVSRREKTCSPCLVFSELPLIERVLRDMKDEDIEEIIVDDMVSLQRVKNFLKITGIPLNDRLHLWDKREDMFETLGLEEKLEKVFARKIPLPSGGYIIIDQAEALTAIDVNSGSFTGSGDPEQTTLVTNMEAVREIAYQLRLRGIGGLIIVDLIDMEREEYKEAVFRELIKQTKFDRAKVSVKKISELGLIEMTREHYGTEMKSLLQENCWYCDGTGSILSKRTICGKIFRSISRFLKGTISDLVVTAHQSIVLKMENEFRKYVDYLKEKYQVEIIFDPRVDVHVEYYNISEKK